MFVAKTYIHLLNKDEISVETSTLLIKLFNYKVTLRQ